MNAINTYYALKLDNEDIAKAKHRALVGGLWDEIGDLTFAFLRRQAHLSPAMKVLDMGCGCFRCGLKLIDYLEPGNYYGIDINQDLIKAGFHELEQFNLQNKLPLENININDEFDASVFGIQFDIVIAQSLWTHLPLNHIQKCLAAVEKVLGHQSHFFSTAFICPEDRDLLAPFTQNPGGITTYRDRDPYHYRVSDFMYLINQLSLDLEFSYIGDWHHPRSQMMLKFQKK